MARRRKVGVKKSHPRQPPCSPVREEKQKDKEKDKPLQHFYRIIHPNTNPDNTKLNIPSEFVKRFGNELSEFVDLIVPNGLAWRVRLRKSNDSIWFEDGWKEFAEHHSIGFGSFLVFGYRGSSNFTVVIFDMSASEIEYPFDSPKCGEGLSLAGQSSVHTGNGKEGSNSVEFLGSTIPLPCSSSKVRVSETSRSNREFSKRPTMQKQDPGSNKYGGHFGSWQSLNCEHSHCPSSKKPLMEGRGEVADFDGNGSMKGKLDDQGVSSPSSFSLNEVEECSKSRNRCKSGESKSLPQCEEDVEISVGNEFTLAFGLASHKSEQAIRDATRFMPQNPHFKILLRPYNISARSLYVPVGFDRTHLSAVHGYIRLQVSDRSEWPIHVMRRKSGGLNFGRGWSKFIKENKLEEGDVCVFELLDNNFLFKVTIFQAVQVASPENYEG